MTDTLTRLDEAVKRTVGRMRKLLDENSKLREEVAQLRRTLEGLQAEYREKSRVIDESERKQAQVRTRLASALDRLAGLNETSEASSRQG